MSDTVFQKIGKTVKQDMAENRMDPYTEGELLNMFGGFGKADKLFSSVTSGSPNETGKCITYFTDFLNGLTGKSVAPSNTSFFGHEIAKTPVHQVESFEDLVIVVGNKENNLSYGVSSAEIHMMIAELIAAMSGIELESHS